MATEEIRVLLVEGDEDLRATLSSFISRMGLRVSAAGDVPGALIAIRGDAGPFDIVLTDLNLTGGTGLDVLRAARVVAPHSLVIVLAGYASFETAIEAMRAGSCDYIPKPFSLEEIGVLLRNMIERVALFRENASLSLRLQEVSRQLDTYRSERAEMLKFQESILGSLRAATGKSDPLPSPGSSA